MNKHFIGVVLLFSILSGVFFQMMASPQSKYIRPNHASSLNILTNNMNGAKVSGLQYSSESVTSVAQPPDVITTWRDNCVNKRLEITGTGMGDWSSSFNPQTIELADSAEIEWLLAQVAGRNFSGNWPVPDSVTFTTDAPQTLMVSQPTKQSPNGYTFEANLQPASQITASVSSSPEAQSTLRGLIIYTKRDTPDQWTSIGKTTNGYVYAGNRTNIYTEVFTFTPLAKTTDLHVTAAVIDNNDDSRIMKLEAMAGNISTTVTETSPTDGPLLNIVHLTLPQVPAGTDRISVTLESPLPVSQGDSLVLVGVNVSYRCEKDNGFSGIYLPIILVCPPFIDTFDFEGSGWPKEEDETPGLKPGYRDSEYYMFTKNTNIQYAMPFLTYFNRYEVKVDVRWTEEFIGEAYGIAFGIVRDNKGRIGDTYLFQVRSDERKYRLLRRLNKSWHYYLDGWKAITNSDKGWVTPVNLANPILPITSTNTLKVVRKFPQIELYVNGEHLVTASDSAILAGQVGLNVMSYLDQPNSEARFDNYYFHIPCDEAGFSENRNILSAGGDLPSLIHHTSSSSRP